MRIKTFGTVILTISVLTASLMGGDEFNKGGRTAFQFLKLGIGARQTSMGEACIAVVQDANAIFWNPASIMGDHRVEAAFTYNSLYADLNYLTGAASVRIGRMSAVAFGYAALDYGDIQEALTRSGEGTSNTRTGENFSGNDLLAVVSFARAFTDHLTIGLSVKYISEKLWIHTVDTYAYDVGTFYDAGYKGIRIAMSAQNFGAQPAKWLDKSDRINGYDIPIQFKFGLSANLLGGSEAFLPVGNSLLQVSAEVINSNDFAERYHFGMEYWLMNIIAVRAGYRLNYEEGNFSFGLGLQQDIGGRNLSIDYSYVSYEYLASPQRLTISMQL